MTINRKELAAGVIFIAFGAFFALMALETLSIGNAFRMGPGYFPLILAGLLVLLGIGVAIQGITIEKTPFGSVSWRGVILILAAPIFFGVTIENLGLLGSVFFSCLIATVASRKLSILRAIAVSVLLTVFCVALFGYALTLNIPIFGPWLGGGD
ncbi:tripartite tricarboxylate transporter TctB family protein [Rhizobium sp. P32RR-XVIII]|uniref:tripartite tricarboxylate transporter TctB family protein n=1 Tax=Rhizobium sp. P32RR-XVIII TaxID=2726738 RepID=UPI001456EE57|nr:tripartite tricarboxylate transporter TctB family protein [Rhizobium sp. P32RR-XVIII]NLS06081.1 tripartite tricarboxylate transporter TctB family protein [Rhizobium sp. P32RR-XVIII]